VGDSRRSLALPSWFGDRRFDREGVAFGWSYSAAFLLSLSGIVALTIVNSGWFGRAQEEAPLIYGPPVDPLAARFVYFFAIAPVLAWQGWSSSSCGLFGSRESGASFVRGGASLERHVACIFVVDWGTRFVPGYTLDLLSCRRDAGGAAHEVLARVVAPGV